MGRQTRMELFPEPNWESGELELGPNSAVSRLSGFISHSPIWASLSSNMKGLNLTSSFLQVLSHLLPKLTISMYGFFQRETLKQASEHQWCTKGKRAEKICSDAGHKGVIF